MRLTCDRAKGAKSNGAKEPGCHNWSEKDARSCTQDQREALRKAI